MSTSDKRGIYVGEGMTIQKPDDEFVEDIDSITLLISRAKLGCDKSRDEVLTRLQPYVATTVQRNSNSMLSSKLGESDIVQRSLIKVFEKFETFRGNSGSQFRAWMKQVISNEVKQTNRNWNRQCRSVERESAPVSNDIAMVANDPTPGTKAVESEQLEILQSSLEKLSERERKIVELRNVENLTFNEIATRLNRNVDAVTKTWYRALIKLQRLMAQDEQES